MYIFVMEKIYIVCYEMCMDYKNIIALMNFCRNKNERDIVCLVKDESDIIDIRKKYYLYKNSIVFGEITMKDTIIPNAITFIGRCKNVYYLLEEFVKEKDTDFPNYILYKYENQEKSILFDDEYIIDIENEVFHPNNTIEWIY
jgi:hypothetical protein